MQKVILLRSCSSTDNSLISFVRHLAQTTSYQACHLIAPISTRGIGERLAKNSTLRRDLIFTKGLLCARKSLHWTLKTHRVSEMPWCALCAYRKWVVFAEECRAWGCKMLPEKEMYCKGLQWRDDALTVSCIRYVRAIVRGCILRRSCR